jgi:thioredoxin-related protein
MKNLMLWTFAGLLLASATIYGFASEKVEVDDKAIHWLTMEEALVAHQKAPKKIFIDTYTDWCGWCKVMDKKTFTDADVIRYINENFYAVKFDAEQREPITFQGHTYQYVPAGRKGIHTLAYSLLDKRPSYPAFVLLNEDLHRFGLIKGYKTPEQFLGLMQQHMELQ